MALIVEEHRDTRELYAKWLIHSGFRVEEAVCIQEALDKARSFRPDIVTTNIGHHDQTEDGCQLCAELKRDVRTRAIPVLAVTAWAMGGNIERAQQAGCDAVLVKPVLPHDLLTEILRLLARRREAGLVSKSKARAR
jgi:CheY-like chemotaxis protein